MKSKIIRGNVMHARLQPILHRFQYPLYMYVFDLEELPALDGRITGFGYNRARPVSIYDADYLDETDGTIREKLLRFLEPHPLRASIHRIELLTSARFFHYVFNPVSFYYCYDADERVICIVVEVNNTFHERHLYILHQPDEVTQDRRLRYIRPKSFHVSPFNDMNGEYDFYFGERNDPLDIQIHIVREQKAVFVTRLWGESLPLTSANLLQTILRYPITAWLNMPRILKEAAVLYYQKRLPVFRKPHPTDAMTIRIAKPTWMQRIAMKTLFHFLNRLQEGALEIELPDHSILRFGQQETAGPVRLVIQQYRFFVKVLRDGDMGFGESFVDGDWQTNDLPRLLALLIDNKPWMEKAFRGSGVKGRWLYRFQHLLNKNTLRGSRKNIHRHYDIGNAFYQLILDPNLLYSSAYFHHPDEGLESAQKNKMQRLIRLAEIQPSDHVLEIGSGWGGMAIETAEQTGCRVTAITVSKEQFEFARKRVLEKGLDRQITVRLCDYRCIQGQYDKILSIEMIEAVGHEYLGGFFAACDRALKPDGLMVLQAITIPDQRYDLYRRRSDWIQQYIFPGAVVPSLNALSNAMTRHSALMIDRVDNIGAHYAETLHRWRWNLIENKNCIFQLGMDETFFRTWLYYLSYCEAGFATRHLNNLQMVITRQNNRLRRSINYREGMCHA